MVKMHGRPSLSRCFHSLVCSGLSAAIAHFSRVAVCGTVWGLRYFKKAELNEKLSGSITIGTFVHEEKEDELTNVEQPDESATRVRESGTRLCASERVTHAAVLGERKISCGRQYRRDSRCSIKRRAVKVACGRGIRVWRQRDEFLPVTVDPCGAKCESVQERE